MGIDYTNDAEIREKILEGIRAAIKNLIKDRKRTGGELVIMMQGKITHIPAKDL
ncbi:MAG TPA: hypothetical protein VK668_20535 [Mucilaginibacter sp.]|nr:hypothetical protein [Mucilaginibacter sp.]